MSVHVIRMPDLGEGIAEVELVAWHVKPGDTVEEDQALADVMTDKATVEIPLPVAGTVASLGGEVGEVLAVGADLIRIDTAEGARDPAAQPEQAAAGPAPAPAPAAGPTAPPAAAEAGGSSPPVALDAAAGAGATVAPTTRSAAAAPALTPGKAPAPRSAPAPQSAAASAAATSTGAAPRKVIASPAVRARAWELGIDIAAVEPSGTAGRVMHADLDAFVERSGSARSTAHGAPGARRSEPAAPARARATAGATDQVRVIGLRRRIAQKMQDSKRRIPHYAYVEEVDVTELETLRGQLNQRYGADRGRITLLPLLIRAIVRALPEFPEINALFDDEAGVLTRHASVHVGIATQTDAGLMVPVLRDAQQGDLWQHAAEIVRLADAARNGKAVRDELTGSTITVTSLGKLGGIATTPVINHPEVAIVGVNKIVARPMVRDGAVAIRQMMNLSSSFDHRVVDGAQAAAFIQRVREALEHPALLFVD